jgi:hypothetical protein
MNKTEMAQVIVQALYAMPTLPAADNKRVRRIAARSKAMVEHQHRVAMKVLDEHRTAGRI